MSFPKSSLQDQNTLITAFSLQFQRVAFAAKISCLTVLSNFVELHILAEIALHVIQDDSNDLLPVGVQGHIGCLLQHHSLSWAVIDKNSISSR